MQVNNPFRPYGPIEGGAPGVYEVDFENFDPDFPDGWLTSREEVDEDPRDPGICEVDFYTLEPRAVAIAEAKISPNLNTKGRPKGGAKASLPPRSTVLGQETWKLYNAMSFLTWQTGLFFGASITLSCRELGFEDHAEFVRLMPAWHKEMNRCLFNGDEKEQAMVREGRQRQRASRRMGQVVRHPHYWIQSVEYSRDHGLHVHVLCVVPKSAEAAFEAKTWDWWRKQSPGEVTPNGIAYRFRHAATPRTQHELQVTLFRYIVKTTAAHWKVRDDEGRYKNAREIFRLAPNDCTPVPVCVPQLAGGSHRLSRGEQLKAGFESKYELGRFDEIYSGWEYEDWKWRQERKATEELLRSLDI